MPSSAVSEAANRASTRARTRSFGFLEHEGASWACYLVTYRTGQRRWCGYLTFRPEQTTSTAIETVRTADLFIESNEAEIERRARGLGRPLLAGLLASALEIEERPSGARLRGWVRHALTAVGAGAASVIERTRADAPDESRTTLRSEYATYRLDQLTHLVTLIQEDDFEDVVTGLLAGESYSFRALDRLQFAMLFAQKLEQLLPLPSFDAFAADFQKRESIYRRYHHDLHADGGEPFPT